MSEDHVNESSQAEFLGLLHARQGHFKLESGHHGNLWLELDLLFLRPKTIQPFVVELAQKISAFNIDAVCGPMVGGALVAQTVALELGIDLFYTERTAPPNANTLYSAAYRLPSHLRPAVRGRRIAIVDDVINAGSAVHGTLATLESAAARPVVIGALLMLGEIAQGYFSARNLPVRWVAYLPNELGTPEACPLCSPQIPLDNLE